MISRFKFNSPMRRAAENKPKDLCRWFLKCDNPAILTMKHPVLGEVPICERCYQMMNRFDDEREKK